MRRIAFLSVLVVFALTAGVTLTPARSAAPAPGLIEYLPDGNAVVVIDFQKIAGSSLWATINAQDKLKGEIDKAQSEVNNLGISLTDVNTVALVFSGASFNTPTVAVSGGFEQSSLLANLRSNSKIKLSSEKYKGIDIYKATPISESAPANVKTGSKTALASGVSKNETAFVFHDSTTLVAGSVEGVRASVDVKSGAKPGVTQNSQLSVVTGLNPSAAIRFAMSLNGVTNGLKSADLPVDFSSISMAFGTIDVAQGINLDATLRSDTAENAKSLSEKLNALLGLANTFLVGSMNDPKLAAIGEALKTVKIVNAETDIRITASVPMDLLNSLMSSSLKK